MSKGELSGECPLLKVSNILSVSLCPLLREMLEKMVPKVIQEKRYSLVKYIRLCAHASFFFVLGVRWLGQGQIEKSWIRKQFHRKSDWSIVYLQI